MKNTFFKMKSLILSLLILSSLALFNVIFGIEKDQNDEFKIKVDVKLKLFDVLVLDSDGNPVKNLKKDNFQLFIDGKKVDIDTFDVVDFSAPQKELEAHNSLSALAGGKRTAFIDSIEDKRLFIIIFHNLPWAQDARKEIADGIFKFIDDNHSAYDYYAVYFFNGPSVVLLLPFTNNSQSVKDVIYELYINNNAGFKPFLPWEGDWIKSIQNEFGSEGIPRIVTSLRTDDLNKNVAPLETYPNLSDHMSIDDMDPKTIYEMNTTLANLDVLLRSFSSFKGRKEVFLFSDSVSLKRYNPLRGYLGKGKTGIEYDRLIDDARTNNITINSFKIDRRNDFFKREQSFRANSVQGSPEELQRQDLQLRIKRVFRKLSNDLKVVAEDTGGLFFENASRKNVITEGLEEAYSRSSCVYYLGVYLSNLELDKSKEHSVRIEGIDEKAEMIYQKSFRLEPDYKKMDDGDRFSQFLDALFGVSKYDTLQIENSLLHFPYGQNRNLLVSVFHLPVSESLGNIINLAIRYYNVQKMLDKQLLRNWNIDSSKEQLSGGNIRFVVGIPLDNGEYIYRYVVRDEENGLLKNAEYIIHLDSSKDIISSPIVFGTAEDAVSKTNLVDLKKQEKNEDKEESEEPEFIIDPALNPFNYEEKIFTPIIGEAIYRNEESYVMFMYNSDRLSINRQHIICTLNSTDGSEASWKLEPAEPEKQFPGGWLRVTLKLPLVKIPPDINKLNFIVTVKDQSGKEIESESFDIKLK